MRVFRMEQDCSSISDVILHFCRNIKCKRRPFVDAAVNRNWAAVGFHDIFYDGESESGSRPASCSCFVRFIKTFKNKRQVLFRYSRAGIFDIDLQSVFYGLSRDMNASAWLRMAQRIIYKLVNTCSILSSSKTHSGWDTEMSSVSETPFSFATPENLREIFSRNSCRFTVS